MSAPDAARRYDIMPDGSGILGLSLGSEGAAGEENGIVVVQNWFEALERLVPTD